LNEPRSDAQDGAPGSATEVLVPRKAVASWEIGLDQDLASLGETARARNVA
jgi:hypothetical protein